MPLRSATTKPPSRRSAKQPIDSGIGSTVLRPVSGSKRLSDGALMSTQYSTCSSADHTGHSPRLALMSSTQTSGVAGEVERFIGLPSCRALRLSPFGASSSRADNDPHRTRKCRAGRKNPGAGARLAALGPVEGVGHLRHRLDGDEVAIRGCVHDEKSGGGIGGDPDVEWPGRVRRASRFPSSPRRHCRSLRRAVPPAARGAMPREPRRGGSAIACRRSPRTSPASKSSAVVAVRGKKG